MKREHGGDWGSAVFLGIIGFFKDVIEQGSKLANVFNRSCISFSIFDEAQPQKRTRF
ncbi:hypothetical protein CYPRO_3266 [Cyclonatronum proteinivorum]|uniref:Uncharacterized protein n=1 Tax=Cyclonatronum proteinivorum TaxID=1457365 RepID=A0A345UPU7_9BACT|nr:hypothetical protein CYPRO_3266 [Cyclonatronum proteinivorum]